MKYEFCIHTQASSVDLIEKIDLRDFGVEAESWANLSEEAQEEFLDEMVRQWAINYIDHFWKKVD